MLHQKLLSKQEKIAVIGLGYVGLPLALAFAKSCSVIAFDKNSERIASLKRGEDPNKDVEPHLFENCDIHYTDNLENLREAVFYIIAVPTPVDDENIPDITLLKIVSRSIGKIIKKGDYVVYESTVYPGCTEDDCIPVIEEESGLKRGVDFKFGYSPERINPGDTKNTLETIIKVVSGCDAEALEEAAAVYSIVAKAGVQKVSSVKVAEAAKVIENAQRDVNIAFMNELSMIFDKVGINTYEVLEAAGSKWNFIKFSPGLVGGHCIGVDPYYLTHKAASLGYESKIINAGRSINDKMGEYVAEKILGHLALHNGHLKDAKVLVMGATFKEDVTDIRNSKVADIIQHLLKSGVTVHVTDPQASSDKLHHEYGFGLTSELANDYEAVIVAVPHAEYKDMDASYFEGITKSNAIIADLKGIYRSKNFSRKYWSL